MKVNNIPYEDRIIPGMEHLSIWNSIKPMSLYTYNHSYCTFRLKLKNIGTEPLKEFKIFLEFEETLNTLIPLNQIVVLLYLVSQCQKHITLTLARMVKQEK